MSTGMEKKKIFMSLLGFMFVLAAAPSVWSADSKQQVAAESKVAKQGASTDTTMAHYEMMGHTEEALHASRGKDMKGAINHAQMALKAGESEQGAFGKEINQEQLKDFNDAMESLKKAVSSGQSEDSKSFEEAAAAAMSKLSEKCHGPGCTTSGCGCGTQAMQTCDPLRPARKCTTVGCNCYCL